jgi:hypothetical protein
LLLVVGFSACDEATSSGSQYSWDDPEYQLAALDQGTPTVSDSGVAPYARVLDRLEPKCAESRSRIGDFAFTAREQLAEEGVTESLLSILQSVDASIPGELGETACIDVFAAFVVLSLE